MLQAERFEDPEEVHRTVAERALSRVWTMIPAIVQEDSDGVTVLVQPAIKARAVSSIDGTVTQKPMLPQQPFRIPVRFPSGGGFSLTHPIKKGDEGHLIVSARCIYGWYQLGGVQAATDLRSHNLSDAVFEPGLRSMPRALSPPPSTTAAQLRSDDGKTYVEIAPGGVVNIVVPASGHVQVTGDLRVTGEIIKGYGTNDQIVVGTHEHANSGGSGQGGPPVAGT